MNLPHLTWFWWLLILGPIGTVVGILTRLARSSLPTPGLASVLVKDEDGAPPS